MKKKLQAPKVKPWPDCTFELEIKWKKGAFSDRHLWVHLARRAPGKFGRLEVMHAIVLGKRADPQARYMFGAKYHKNLYRNTLEIIKQAGVSEKLRQEYFERMNRELPLPTEEELFLSSLESPFLAKILGGRKQEMSYFQTGRSDHPRASWEQFLKGASGQINQMIPKLYKENEPTILTGTGELMTPSESVFDVKDFEEVRKRLDDQIRTADARGGRFRGGS